MTKDKKNEIETEGRAILKEEEERNEYGTTAVSFGWPLLHHVRAMAEKEGVSVSEFVRTATTEFAERHYSDGEFKKLIKEHIQRKTRTDRFRKKTRRAADVSTPESE